MIGSVITEKFVEAATDEQPLRQVKLAEIVNAVESRTCDSCRAGVILELMHTLGADVHLPPGATDQAVQNLVRLGACFMRRVTKA